MFGKNSCGNVGVQVFAGQQRAMSVFVAALKQTQLVHHLGIAMDHTGIIHDLGQPDARPVVHHLCYIIGQQLGTGGFHMGRRNA